MNVGVYARAEFAVSSTNIETTELFITHDDPITLWLNGNVIYRSSNLTIFGHKTVAIPLHPPVLKYGRNYLFAKIANFENINTRAWVIGANFKTPNFVAPIGEVTVLDGACE